MFRNVTPTSHRPGRPSRRDAIRGAIDRRLAAGEDVSVRAILAEVGGSASTVSEELRDKLSRRDPSPQDSRRPTGVTTAPGVSPEALRALMAEMTTPMMNEVRGAMAYSMEKIEAAYARLMEMADQAKQHPASQAQSGTTERPPTRDEAEALIKLHQRIQRLTDDNGRMASEISRLRQLLSNAGIDY